MIGLGIDGRSDGFFNTPSGFLPAKLNPQVPTHDGVLVAFVDADRRE